MRLVSTAGRYTTCKFPSMLVVKEQWGYHKDPWDNPLLGEIVSLANKFDGGRGEDLAVMVAHGMCNNLRYGYWFRGVSDDL